MFVCVSLYRCDSPNAADRVAAGGSASAAIEVGGSTWWLRCAAPLRQELERQFPQASSASLSTALSQASVREQPRRKQQRVR